MPPFAKSIARRKSAVFERWLALDAIQQQTQTREMKPPLRQVLPFLAVFFVFAAMLSVAHAADHVSSGLRGTSSDPIPPPGFWDPAKAWIGEHHPLIRKLAIAQILILASVSGIVFWVTRRRPAELPH
jgi:hypothetical protein